ncbi:hypothetical protein ACFL0O_02875 [Thermodesulfobacteriota bacterium]
MTIPDDKRALAALEDMLSEVRELQKDFVALICPACPVPCCTKVNYLFCEKDILFFKLSGRNSRRRRKASEKKGCRFLGPDGCILDPKSRPFICHRYICSDLEEEIKKQQPGLLIGLREKFKLIDELRSRMWAAYLEERMNPTPGASPGHSLF